jgi:hypothetical protein
MTDRCDAADRRPRDYSSQDTSCEPTREETATARIAAQQAADREAEARRDTYIASGSDEGGRSKRASSDVGAVQTSTADDKNLRIINNAKKYDRPIESDPYGNAIIGVAAGGVIGGIRAGAGEIGLAGARGLASRELVKGAISGEATGGAAVAKGAAIGVTDSAGSAIRGAARSEALKASARGVADDTPGPRAAETPASRAATPPVAGQSSKSGACVPASEPQRSEGPPIPEAVAAPLRIRG